VPVCRFERLQLIQTASLVRKVQHEDRHTKSERATTKSQNKQENQELIMHMEALLMVRNPLRAVVLLSAFTVMLALS
jgi:hypothetical protein